MTDSTELRYGAELVTEVLDAFLEDNPTLPFAIREFIDMAKERANPYANDFTDKIATFFACFSESGDLEHQWNNYADHSRGYCIHMDVMPPFVDSRSDQSVELQRQNVQFLKVIYNRQEQYQLVIEALEDFFNLLQASTNKYGNWAAMFGMPAYDPYVQTMFGSPPNMIAAPLYMPQPAYIQAMYSPPFMRRAPVEMPHHQAIKLPLTEPAYGQLRDGLQELEMRHMVQINVSDILPNGNRELTISGFDYSVTGCLKQIETRLGLTQ